ncbi:hypothetical protein ACJRO7_008893 [Eucalyptus globulus]|uniref:Uncharacterized protein n=1 Tax=Eucalyptus globulus TaxID=34317 RepID=A0ABD3IT15_EUCGL
MMKFPRVGVILLLLVGTLVQPDEARRVLIKGKEEVWAKDKPSVIVLQTLQKGRVPPPGSPGYTPNPPGSIADDTDTRDFTNQAMAPSPEVNPVAFSSNGTIANRK